MVELKWEEGGREVLFIVRKLAVWGGGLIEELAVCNMIIWGKNYLFNQFFKNQLTF